MRENKFIVVVILGVFLLLVLNLPLAVSQKIKAPLRESVAPLQEFLMRTSLSFRESTARLRGLTGLLKENERLAAELAETKVEIRDLKTLERENEMLRTQLNFASRFQYELIPSEIIARDHSGWWQTVRLNKGSKEMIEPDMAVITVEGLVGKTIDVSPQTSDVMLISDPTCKISAQIVRNGAFGIVSGRGPSWKGQVLCRMEFINKNQTILPGDEVITSGLGGIFPQGLLIGYVDQVTIDRSGLYQHADVVTKADIGILQYAFVVRDRANGVEAAP